MDPDPRLNALLAGWRAARSAGSNPRIEDLCRDCPELADRLRAAVFALAGETPDGSATADTIPHPSPPRVPGGDPPSTETITQPSSSTAAEEAGAPPATIGPYRVVGRLGRGGMGEVFVAEDPVLNRRLAVKVMRPELADSTHARARFLREARAAAGLHHDHVVPIYHVGEANGGVFIAMPLLPGETLAARLARGPRLQANEVIRIGRDVARGLAAAHDRGLVHRDVKPSNLWLEAEPDGGFRARILDFGLVRSDRPDDGLSQTGAVVGTPSYMSPEQADGADVNARSDLFSLGAVLYEAAIGRAAFRGPGRTATLRAVAESHTPAPAEVDPTVPPALSELILQLLSKDPAARPPSAAAVADELGQMSGGSVAVPDTGPKRRRPALLLVAALAIGVLIVLGVWAAQRSRGPGPTNDTPNNIGEQIASTGGATDPTGGHGAAAGPRLTGTLGVRVLRKGAFGGQQFALSDPTAPLPIRPDDSYRVHLTVRPPGYVYVVRLAPDGRVVPLYPWAGGRWAGPDKEGPVDELVLPGPDGGYPVDGEDGGFERLVVVVRPTPLGEPTDGAAAVFGGLPPQRQFRPDRPVAWFENSRLLSADGPAGLAQTDDPVLQVQDFLAPRLQPHAGFTAAVSFARLGRPKAPVAPNPPDPPDRRAELERRVAALSEAVVAASRTGRFAEAISKQQDLLKLSAELYPKDQNPNGHPAEATAMSSLGMLYFQIGRVVEAEALFREALTMQQKMLGPDHPETTTSYANLGFVLHAMGRPRDAVPLLKTALESRRRTLGPDHPTVAQAMTNLGVVLRDTGEVDKAIPLLEDAGRIWSRLYPPDRYPDGHPSQASGLMTLGLALQDAGRPDDARAKFAQALEVRQHLFPAAKFPNGHPDLAATHRRLGTALRDAKRYKEAVAELDSAVAMDKRLYRDGNPELAGALTDLGDTLARAAADPSGKDNPALYGRAIPVLEEAVAIYERLYPADRYPNGHPRLADALAALGSVLDRTGQPEKAREYARRADAIRAAVAPKKNGKP